MAQTSEFKLNENGIPAFDDLPLRKGDPKWAAWGLYGNKDELGTLNRLTDKRVAAAAKSEIQIGTRISLNMPLNPHKEGAWFSRRVFHQDLLRSPDRTVNDDLWTFNTQATSQWDGLRHFGYQKEQLFYNGVTQEDIHGTDADGKKTTMNGIQAWAEKGIVGRGILVDYDRWRKQQSGPEYEKIDPFETTAIPLKDLKACLAAQGTKVQFGDILLVRSGWLMEFQSKAAAEIATLQQAPPHKFIGVEQSEDMARWLWENFSAVGGDHPTFEAWPTRQNWALHEILLAGWGCPIGELFDLEKLAAECERLGRWSFFLASEPCNVLGGVASPPNILAIM